MARENPYDYRRYIDEECGGKDLSQQINEIMGRALTELGAMPPGQSGSASPTRKLVNWNITTAVIAVAVISVIATIAVVSCWS
jgi:hypothetical protein